MMILRSMTTMTWSWRTAILSEAGFPLKVESGKQKSGFRIQRRRRALTGLNVNETQLSDLVNSLEYRLFLHCFCLIQRWRG